MPLLPEPFTGLWNRRCRPMLDGSPDRLAELLGPIGIARPCREKLGNLVDVDGDDLIWVLPPGTKAPTISPELLAQLVGAVDRGRAVLLWATDPRPIAAVRHVVEPLVCAGRA